MSKEWIGYNSLSDMPVNRIKPPANFAFTSYVTRGVPMKPCSNNSCGHKLFSIFIGSLADAVVCEKCEDATMRAHEKTPKGFKGI